MDETRKIKALKSQLSTLKQDASALSSEIRDKQIQLKVKTQQIRKKEEEINKLEFNGNIRVTEHAMLRYLERVKGIDLDKLEKEIITEEVINMVKVLGGNGSYPNNGVSLKMKNGTITTIY